MEFLKLFNYLARPKKPVMAASAVSEDKAAPIDIEIHDSPREPVIDKTQYYKDANRSLREAIGKLEESLVVGKIHIESNDHHQETLRITTRFPPDDSLHAPEVGYVMEVFDIRICALNKSSAPTYEVNRWAIDDIFLPETADGTFKGSTALNLEQVLNTILRRSERLKFIDDEPPAARSRGIAKSLTNG